MVDKVDFGRPMPRDWMTDDELIKAFKISDKQEIIYRITQRILRTPIATTYDNEESFIYSEGVWERDEQKLKELIEKELGYPSDTNMINEIIGHVKRRTYVKREIFNSAPPNLICVKNGVINLETKELIPYSPFHYFVNKIPVEFHNPSECPAVDKFISEVFPKEKIELAYEMAGYCLYRGMPIHRAFMLLGEGSNGKSTWINFIKELLGNENCAGISLHEIEYNRFATSQLYGKMANFFADISSNELTGTSRFKALTGNDFIQAEKKFKDGFCFTNYSKLIFSANQLPKSKDESNAFIRRWIIIPFTQNFPEEIADKGLIKKLTTKEELEGFLFKAVCALNNLLKRGDFSCSKSIEDNREIYLRLSNPAWCFIQDCIEISPEDHVVKEELYQKFIAYCKTNHYPVASLKEFVNEVVGNCKVIDRQVIIGKERKRCYVGIKYAQDAQDARVIGSFKVVEDMGINNGKNGVQPVNVVQSLKNAAQDAQGFSDSPSEAQGGPQSAEGVNSVGSQALSSDDGHTAPALKPAETVQKIREICAELSGSFNSIIPPKTIFEVAERRGISIIAANAAIEALRNSGELQHVPQKGFKLTTQKQGADS